jgi:hypothetical protein
MAVEGTPQRQSGGIVNTIANILVFTLCITALYAGRHYIGEMIAPVLDYSSNTVSAPLMATALPLPTIAPVVPQQAPIVIRVENSDPAPVIAVQPAQQAPQPASVGAELQPTIAPVVVIVHRVTSGGQVITGTGACRVNSRVAARCGK